MQEKLDYHSYINVFNYYFNLRQFYNKIDQLHIIFSLIGFMIWFLGYAILSFYKDYFITYCRKDEKFGRGFYYNYVKYQSCKKLVYYFNVFYLIFVAILLYFVKMKYYCLLSGLCLFSFFYTAFLIKYYLFDKNKFDLFDDYTWMYKSFIKYMISTKKGDSSDDRK